MAQIPTPPPGGMMAPHRGTMILVFGLLGILCCQIFAIVAWVMGKGDLAKIRAGQMDPAGEGTTKAGMILGIVGTILMIVGIIAWVIALATGASFFAMNVPRH